MATVYTSKIDWWLAALLVFAIAASLWACIRLLQADSPASWLSILLIAGSGVVLPVWLMVGTHYTLDSTHLKIKSGPFKWRILIADITSVAPSSNPMSSPALSLDRIRIDYGQRSVIMISPRDKVQFMQDLETRRGIGAGN